VLGKELLAELLDELPVKRLAAAVEPTDHPADGFAQRVEALERSALAGDAQRADPGRVGPGRGLAHGTQRGGLDLVDVLLHAAVGRRDPLHRRGALGHDPPVAVDHQRLDVGRAQVKSQEHGVLPGGCHPGSTPVEKEDPNALPRA